MMTALLGPAKALVEVICDDEEGAEKTLDEFTKTNPMIFPFRATADLITDGPNEAIQTCKTFGNALDNMPNSTPVVGHVKGAITAACGEEEKGEEIIKQAIRNTVVAGAGVGEFALGGLAGAFAFDAEAGTLCDLTRAAVAGPANGVAKLVTAIEDDEDLSAGDVFDCVTTPVIDEVTGVAAGEMANRLYKNYKKNQAREIVQNENTAKQEQTKNLEKKIADQGMDEPEKVVKDMSQDSEELTKKVDEIKSKISSRRRLTGHTASSMIDDEGNKSTGYSIRLCKELKMNRFVEETSKLQQTFPNIHQVLDRALDCCAEHMAFENLPGNLVITYAVQIYDGIVKCVERCENCAQYPISNVVTDALHGEWIPSALEFVPAAGSYIEPVVSGIIYITLENGRKSTSRRYVN